ncbi:MAG: hydantoinase/oxoprolinase family protein [Caulobacteraceae bacterium]|nr:hydantoinase/oxoprolinase family protein [Caulobacteraceae bacterium]
MYRIGVDIGGTNTDAAIMRGREVVETIKAPTSADVTQGVAEALNTILQRSGVPAGEVGAVVIGTTHFTNAVIERRHLEPVAVVRLCLPATQSLPPLVDWPDDIHAVVGDNVYFTSGGYEFDGRPISSLDEADLQSIGRDIHNKGVRCIAVCAVFSSINDAMERRAAEILAASCPGALISISSSIGRLGLLERENATALNSSLLGLARRTVLALHEALAESALGCPFYLSQNDGTLMSAAHAQQYPVLTFASGPTNSMRGAAFLTQCQETIVVDIGGTTTDVGLLQHGFPREATHAVDIGGVRTNFRMPDLFSVGLGGGSIVAAGPQGAKIGPQSVGFEINRKALIFGGEVVTATDVAVAAGRTELGDRGRTQGLDRQVVASAIAEIDRMLEAAVDRVRVSAAPLPVVVVGGGSILAPSTLAGLQVVKPRHFEVANAIGAAIAQASGQVDKVYSLDLSSRDAVLAEAEHEARAQAIQAGALEETLVVTDREDVPLTYLPGNATRVRVKVVGDMRF